MTTLARHRIDPLLDEIAAQRRIVDERLPGPAQWRGLIRREFTKRTPAPEERARLAATFDRLVAMVTSAPGPLTEELLIDLHRGLTGDGGAYRSGGARVGRRVTTPHPRHVPRLVATVLDRANDGVEPPLLATIRVHMELLFVHPFADGNGRTARMAAAWLLLNAGFRSTLFTAVEQHSQMTPRRYSGTFREIHAFGDQEPWLVAALEMMRDSSRFAAGFRQRELSMRSALTDAGVPPEDHDRVMLDFDLKHPNPHVATSVLNGPRFTEITSQLTDRERAAYGRQVERLIAEETAALPPPMD